MKKRILINALLFSTLASTISCELNKHEQVQHQLNSEAQFSETESYIFSNISLNTQSITVYDSIGGLTTTSLEITNLSKFNYYGIYLSLGKTKIDYENEEVQIEIFYRTKKDKKEKLIHIKKSFLEFKPINSNDWDKIFNGMAQFSIIEIFTNNNEWKVNIKNDYAEASDIIISPFEGNLPPTEKISYKLTAKNSKKIVGQNEDIKSNKYLSGGRTKEKPSPLVKFKGWNNDFWTRPTNLGRISKLEITPTKPGSKFLGWAKNISDSQPNLFINGSETEEFLEDTSVYAVFEFDNPVITVETPDKQKHTYEIKYGMSAYKEEINKWLLDINKNRWDVSLNNAIVKSKNTKWKLRFYDDGKAELDLQKGKEFELKLEWREKNIINFKDTNNKTIAQVPIETGQNFIGEKSLKFPSLETIKSEIKEKRKKIVKLYWNKTNEEYVDRLIKFSELDEIQKDWVVVETQDFGTIRVPDKINLETGETSFKLINKTEDGRIEFESLPGEIKIKKKNSWVTNNNKNNPVLDKRTQSQKEAGLVLTGWTLKKGSKNPIIFKNGISEIQINTEQIYPILKSDGWAEREKARTIINWAATLAEAGITIAKAAENTSENEKHYETAISVIKITDKLLTVFLGGTIENNILREIKHECIKIAENQASEYMFFVKGAEILADILLDISEYWMNKNKMNGRETPIIGTWNKNGELWDKTKYQPKGNSHFAERNFREAAAWLTALLHRSNKDWGLHKHVDTKDPKIERNNKERDKTYDLWSWSLRDKKVVQYDWKVNGQDEPKKEDKEHIWEEKWLEVLWERFKDINYDEERSKEKHKIHKWKYLKAIAAKNGLFDAIIKMVTLMGNWENKKPEQRAQELILITVKASSSIATIVKNLKK
ncbi:hypothetical protein [Mycoplasma phocimorsus]|uniref:hypothetical protein n=1 Tax=Mycoplasma phocimorsus TaxID=3045839 RepID=UPI0024BFCFA9|nr:hypothetical protein [Mycoplasma phocimorsus]MDJ1648545.1 hypothetical protein [Mycoplasma phocimorsus]